MMEVTRCGFVAVLGAPNVGKSTLVNRVVGAKVSIVSAKVQTTRRRVLGVAVRGAAQIVFIDTPGIFPPRRRLDRAMIKAAWSGAAEADIILLLVDATRPTDEQTRSIIDGIAQSGRTAWLAINKIDVVRREQLLTIASELNALHAFSATFMISAEKGDGVEDLVASIARTLPEGPHHFPPDQLTDLPERLLAAEITREQLFRRLHQEVPYALTVETEAWEEFDDGSAKVNQVIFVAREAHKAIVVGQGGRQIKSVREAAQRELEKLLGRKLHLFLFVKTREKWQDDPERYREMGLDYDA